MLPTTSGRVEAFAVPGIERKTLCGTCRARGEVLPVIVAPAVIVGYLFIRSIVRRDSMALSSLVVAAAGTVVALAANVVATTVWFRARPYAALSQVHALVASTAESSFFSDHTIAVTGLALGALLVSRRWGGAALGAALLVSVARVAVGAHYPTDVITAAAVTSLAIVVLLPARHAIASLIARGLDRLPSRRAHPGELVNGGVSAKWSADSGGLDRAHPCVVTYVSNDARSV